MDQVSGQTIEYKLGLKPDAREKANQITCILKNQELNKFYSCSAVSQHWVYCFYKKFKNNREKGEQSSNTLKLWINSKQMNMNKRIPWGLLHMFPKLGLLPLLSDGSGELCWSCFFPVKTHLPSKSHMFDRKSSSLAIPTPGGRSARYVSSNRDTKRDSPRTSTWKDLLDTQEPVSTTPASWT